MAEDLPENRELLTGFLASLGFTVRTASNGLEVVAQCESELPGLVILDLRMPVMDGFEAALRLRAAHGTAVKILALSASISAEVRAQALEAGADAFLGKPFGNPELLESIRTVTGVEYLRGEPETVDPGTGVAVQAEMPRTEAVRRLPAELVQALQEALAAADYLEMLAVVAQAERFDGKRHAEDHCRGTADTV